jgi:hypothetical protein
MAVKKKSLVAGKSSKKSTARVTASGSSKEKAPKGEKQVNLMRR